MCKVRVRLRSCLDKNSTHTRRLTRNDTHERGQGRGKVKFEGYRPVDKHGLHTHV